jgi:hypothetical protein
VTSEQAQICDDPLNRGGLITGAMALGSEKLVSEESRGFQPGRGLLFFATVGFTVST